MTMPSFEVKEITHERTGESPEKGMETAALESVRTVIACSLHRGWYEVSGI